MRKVERSVKQKTMRKIKEGSVDGWKEIRVVRKERWQEVPEEGPQDLRWIER